MKNVSELRNQLAVVFKELRAGGIEVKDAEALANIAGKMVNSAVAQIKLGELRQDRSTDIAFLREDT